MSPQHSESADSLEILERRIGYQFVDKDLLLQALTHRSQGEANNERLEFLGDAALGFVVAEWLYRLFPDVHEHELTVMRASLVKKPTLAVVAREIGLGQYLRLGVGERRSGGRQRESILADTLEALLGAVLRDGGIKPTAAVVETLFAEHMGRVDVQTARDSKTILQELLQARRMSLPVYTVASRLGDAHTPQFTIACRIIDLGIITQGQAGSRREAEQAAAALALDELGATHGQ